MTPIKALEKAEADGFVLGKYKYNGNDGSDGADGCILQAAFYGAGGLPELYTTSTFTKKFGTEWIDTWDVAMDWDAKKFDLAREKLAAL